MKVRKAQKSDVDSVKKIYERVHDGEEKGMSTTGWIRNVYPTGKTAEDALNRGDLFVMTDDGKIVAAAVINRIQGNEYKDVAWKHDVTEHEVMVLHGLAVDPLEMSKGYGRAFIAFYEDYAKHQNCSDLRMDTNVKNIRAKKLYQALGYETVGVVSCAFNGIPDVQLVCFEKYLR